MGYYASCYGSILYDGVLSEESYKEVCEIISWAFGSVDGCREFNHYGTMRTEIDFDYYEKYYEDEVLFALNKAAEIGKIFEGEACFSDDANEFWRFIYRGSEWECQVGHISYEPANKIKVVLPSGFKLVAEKSNDNNYPYEIYVGLETPDGFWWQDLVTIANDYVYGEDGEARYATGDMSVKVYSNENNEDFTHEYIIGLYEEG